jgi:hypothetical protein
VHVPSWGKRARAWRAVKYVSAMAISTQEQQLRAEAREALLEQIKKMAPQYEDPAALLRLAEAYALVSQDRAPGKAVGL